MQSTSSESLYIVYIIYIHKTKKTKKVVQFKKVTQEENKRVKKKKLHTFEIEEA